jgi:hypothetical protein
MSRKRKNNNQNGNMQGVIEQQARKEEFARKGIANGPKYHKG